jgi:hypothetical protein
MNYKGIWLAKNSEAYSIWEKKDFAKLDKHLKDLDTKEKELVRRYEPKAK